MTFELPSPDSFAAALAACLNQVVPPGLSVRSQGISVNVYSARTSRHAGAGAQRLGELTEPVEKQIEGIAWAILNGAQDGIMDILTEQWPLGSDGRAAEPGARVEGDQLRMWFGEERAPVLTLPPLDLRGLRGAA
jgi:hypothetical protein